MGSVEAKLSMKKDEAPVPHPPPPSTTTKFMETVNEQLARMKMEEPAEADGAQERAAIAKKTGSDQAPESPQKAVGKGDGPRFRPDGPDCAFYMKTGTCKFGMNCKFNHPPKRRGQLAKLKKQSEDGRAVEEKRWGSGTKMMGQTTRKVDEKETEVGKFVEKEKKFGKVDEKEKKIAKSNFKQENAGGKQKGVPLKQVEKTETKVVEKKKQTPFKMLGQEECAAANQSCKERTSDKIEMRECKFYTMPGGCKFGKSCKYVHPQTKTEVAPLELNFLGLPIRPGARECSYYMHTGTCKFATYCKYHHPDPTEVTVEQDPLPFLGYQNRGSMQQIAVEESPMHVMPNVTHATRQVPSFVAASPYSAGTSLDPQVFHSNWQSGTH